MSDKDTNWQTHIDLYLTKKSSQTQKRFCEENSLPKDRFKYHYRRLHLKTINNKSTPKEKQKRLTLAPVSVVANGNPSDQPSITSEVCTIHLPNGTKINLHDAQLVERYLSRSMGLC
jgi:hypothetical protein